MTDSYKTDFRSAVITALITIIPYTVINQLFTIINRNLSDRDYISMRSYFARYQPDYYPILFMFILFISLLIIVSVYSMLEDRLPRNWISKGVLLGLFLFFVADLPYAVYTGYTTMMPGSYARGMASWGLAGDIVNGALIVYIFNKVKGWEKKT